MIADITHALKELCPDAQFAVRNEEYAGIEWHSDGIAIPTELEVNAKIEEIKIQLDLTKFKKERERSYPSIGDQLDALFHAGVFPPEMAAKIQTVKDQYPKPSTE